LRKTFNTGRKSRTKTGWMYDVHRDNDFLINVELRSKRFGSFPTRCPQRVPLSIFHSVLQRERLLIVNLVRHLISKSLHAQF